MQTNFNKYYLFKNIYNLQHRSLFTNNNINLHLFVIFRQSNTIDNPC